MSSADRYLALITSEHNQQPKFMAMMELLCSAMGDITAAAQALTDHFDLDTAEGAQLDIIGLWVGQSRVIPKVLLTGFFGFADSIVALPFGEITDTSIGGEFYEFGAPYSGTTILMDQDYRTILKARIVRNQSSGTIADLENALSFIFNAPSFVTDNSDLSFAITVATPITPTAQALLNTMDILPRPAGVRISSISYTP